MTQQKDAPQWDGYIYTTTDRRSILLETTVEEAPKKKNARPPRRSKQADSTPTSRLKPFPAAPKSMIKHGTIPQEKFWAYRKSLPEEFKDRMVFYVYRDWPVLDYYQMYSVEEIAEMRAHHKRAPFKYIAKYADIDPDDWRNHILRFHGSGIYKLHLNDSGLRGQEAAMCKTVIELRDDEFPPVVDLAILDMNDPSNASFINDLRMKGINIPGDAPKGEEDVAATVAVEKLADALIEQSKTKPQDNVASGMLSDLLKQSEARHMKELELAEARHVRDMEAIMKRLEAAETAAKSAPTTTDQVIAMAQAITPKAPPDNGMLALLSDMLKSEKANRIEELKLLDARHAREMEALTKRLETLDAREAARLTQQQTPLPGAAPTANNGTSSAIKDVLAVLKGVNDLRSGIEGIGGDTGGTGNPWVDLASEHLPKVLDTISNVTTAMRGTPAPTQPQAQQQSGTALQQQTQQPQQQDTSEMGQMATYARMIRQPLIQCLSANPTVPGHRFAGILIVQYGDAAYNYLCQQGADGVLAILQAAPEVWGDVQRFGAKVPQFLTEFLDAPRAMEQAQAIRAGQGQRPSMPASAPPQQQGRPIIVDAPSASAVPPAAGRTIIRGDGQAVKTTGPVNGPVVEPTA